MELRDYHTQAIRTAPSADTANNLLHAALGVAVSAGKLAHVTRRLALWHKDIDRAAVVRELGDLLWHVTLAAQAIGADLDEVASANLQRLIELHTKR